MENYTKEIIGRLTDSDLATCYEDSLLYQKSESWNRRLLEKVMEAIAKANDDSGLSIAEVQAAIEAECSHRFFRRKHIGKFVRRRVYELEQHAAGNGEAYREELGQAGGGTAAGGSPCISAA